MVRHSAAARNALAFFAEPFSKGPRQGGLSVIKNAICEQNQKVARAFIPPAVRSAKIRLMVALAVAFISYLRALLVPRHKLALEAAALRQQLAVFKRKQSRPKLYRIDRLFWIALRRLWSGWPEALIIVKPETVVSWHRAGFRLFWRWRSRPRRTGRPKVSKEIRQLIRRMKAENPTWAHLAYMVSCCNWDSIFRSRPYRVICEG